ncbi:ubiA prenyltransferase domain-containing protein 1-like [Saccostrea echinata]|uniref:ubiA prenyltransferase domain-containing protein 1-like n=1 Tax=Saccostrea echinata TaxID=191078 RepID=UPI002A82DB56|nr:ubiA prenyltransferase domain-containing protein 1-like [Saccostrea echinata]
MSTKHDINGIDNCTSQKERKNMRSMTSFSLNLRKYFVALRPWSFTASLTPVALGSTLAYKATSEFSLSIFLVTCLSALSVHAAGNLVNTYFDYLKGIDSKKASDDRTLVDNVLPPVVVSNLGAFFYIMGCLGCFVLTFLSPAKMEHLALIYFGGLSSSFLYTGGLGLKYIALGDLLIFLTFGPLTVMFAYLSQTGHLSTMPVLYALPLALNTESILHANNTRDMESDRKAGIVTMAILLGKTGSYFFFAFLLFVPFIIFVLMGLHLSSWMFLPLICLPEAFSLERVFRDDNLQKLPQKVAKLNLFLGILYTIGCILSNKAAFVL